MEDEARSGYKPVQDDVLKTLGLAVIAGQGVEHLLSSCLTFPLHGEPLQTIEQLHILLERHSKATLGQLLKALRKRVDLHPTFDEMLDRFLQNRNVIAHRLHDVPGGLTCIPMRDGIGSRLFCSSIWMMAIPSAWCCWAFCGNGPVKKALISPTSTI